MSVQPTLTKASQGQRHPEPRLPAICRFWTVPSHAPQSLVILGKQVKEEFPVCCMEAGKGRGIGVSVAVAGGGCRTWPRAAAEQPGGTQVPHLHLHGEAAVAAEQASCTWEPGEEVWDEHGAVM